MIETVHRLGDCANGDKSGGVHSRAMEKEVGRVVLAAADPGQTVPAAAPRMLYM